MIRTLLIAVLLLAATPAWARDFFIVIPLDISGMPPEVMEARVTCLIKDAAVRGPSTGHSMGQALAVISLVNGRYSGQIRVMIVPGGYPSGYNPIPDVRYYRCRMVFQWACTTSTSMEGVCLYIPTLGESHSRGAALFRRATGQPFSYIIEGEIDPSTAVVLPRRLY